jgi:hypothetical protein
MNKKIVFAFLALALASMACGFSVDLPKAPTPGPDITDQITVVDPKLALSGVEESNVTRLGISFGAGKLKLSPDAKDLVNGTATYNIPELKPQIIKKDGDIRIEQGDFKFNNFATLNNVKNDWDLKLGATPMDLSIEAGAYAAVIDLGGLSLTSLTIKDGAADVKLSFSSPNPTEMSLFRYETGASDVKLEKLANANFGAMNFQSGAGDYTLDFNGELKRSATVMVNTGLSNMILVIPDGVNAVVTVDSGISNISAGSNWKQNGNVYTQSGSGPKLTFMVQMGAGNLTLTR